MEMWGEGEREAKAGGAEEEERVRRVQLIMGIWVSQREKGNEDAVYDVANPGSSLSSVGHESNKPKSPKDGSKPRAPPTQCPLTTTTPSWS